MITTQSSNPKLHQVMHPLLAHKMGILRSKETPSPLFRQLLHEMTLLIASEATISLKTESIDIETPMSKMKATALLHKTPVIVPILRSGLGMLEAFLTLLPQAHVGYLGFKRDEVTHAATKYYDNCPRVTDTTVFLIDPMLATGGTAILAIDTLKSLGATQIEFCCIIAAPEGIQALHRAHPDVCITTGDIDERLNSDAYIIPGLGDAGDRLYGTATA